MRTVAAKDLTIGICHPAYQIEPVVKEHAASSISRPSLSYWQDSWRRLRVNRRALISLYLLIALAIFTIAGPLFWTVDPAMQDVDRISEAPGLPASATIVEPYQAWDGVRIGPGATATTGLRLADSPTTEAVRLHWDRLPGVTGYRIYRSVYDPAPDRALGLPLGETFDPSAVNYEDRLGLKPITYWYSVVGLDSAGRV